MIVVAISGKSNSGKTTLIEMLIKEFNSMGIKVLAVKHGKHFELDREGKDSYRMWCAGANVAMIGDGFTALMVRGEIDPSKLGKIVGADVVLVEGFKNANIKKIVIGDISCEGKIILRLRSEDIFSGKINLKELALKILNC